MRFNFQIFNLGLLLLWSLWGWPVIFFSHNVLVQFRYQIILALKKSQVFYLLYLFSGTICIRKKFLVLESFVKLFVKNHQNLCLNDCYNFYLENCPSFLSFHIYWQKLFIMFYDFKLSEFLVHLFMPSFFAMTITLRQLFYSSFPKNQILALWILHFLSFVFVIFCSYWLLLFSSPLIIVGSWIKWLAHVFNNFLRNALKVAIYF